MQESKDPAIKLFGKEIPLQGEAEGPPSLVAIDVEKEGEEEDDGGQKRPEEKKDEAADKEYQSGKVTESPQDKEAEPLPDASVNPKTPFGDEETVKSSKNNDGTNSEEKALKNPDEVLPCPRCNSMDTKFCYYNNYNINQPRHFCRSCQRYWTAGGTMRNVPVGAGRRKSKNSSSHYRCLTISEALRAARIDVPDGTRGKVLSFGLNAPICDSMTSFLNLGENNVVSKGTPIGFRNHIFKNQRQKSSTIESKKNSLQIPPLPGVPWPQPPGFPPVSFYHPTEVWNYGVSSNWNLKLSWLSSNSSSPTLRSPTSDQNSPALGKRRRDGNMLDPGYLQKEGSSKQRKGSVLVPKTLRIDDPGEAAKSSIWATLGIAKNESLSRGGLFGAVQSRKDVRNQKDVETSSILRANPAALSRSVNFHEDA